MVKSETVGWQGKNDSRPAHTREARFGCVFTQTTWDEQGSERVLASVHRFEEQGGAIARIREYAYCPDTINEVAAELGVKAAPRKYHQDPATLQRMIAESNLPWTKDL